MIMIISVNSTADSQSFEGLLSRTLFSLHKEAKKNPQKFLHLLGNKLEKEVADMLDYNAKGTPFEKSIELISGQRFPDIIAKKYYGVEVKTTQSNHWKSTGSSVAEGTRVDNIERIFMLFGKMCDPIEFMCRPYEECLSEVVVTHSPRYLIDMNLKEGETFFDKLNIPYNTLRKQENPIKTVINFYKKQLKKGDDVWWIDNDSNASNFIVRIWNNLKKKEREEIIFLGYCLFPELVSSHSDKFNRFAIWLSVRKGIVCPNVRDVFTAGGQGILVYNNVITSKVPRILMRLTENISLIKSTLYQIGNDELSESWNCVVTTSTKWDIWKSLICKNINPQFFPLINNILNNEE